MYHKDGTTCEDTREQAYCYKCVDEWQTERDELRRKLEKVSLEKALLEDDCGMLRGQRDEARAMIEMQADKLARQRIVLGKAERERDEALKALAVGADKHLLGIVEENQAETSLVLAHANEDREKLRVALLQVRDLLDVLRKVDAFFEDPKIVTAGDRLVLDIPYETAAGVKGALLPKAPFFEQEPCPRCNYTRFKGRICTKCGYVEKRKGLDGIEMNRDPKWLEKMAKLEDNQPVAAGAWPDVYEPCDGCGAIKPKGEGCLGCAGRKG